MWIHFDPIAHSRSHYVRRNACRGRGWPRRRTRSIDTQRRSSVGHKFSTKSSPRGSLDQLPRDSKTF